MPLPAMIRTLAEAIDSTAWNYNRADKKISVTLMAIRKEESIEAAQRVLEALLEPSGSMLAEMPVEARDSWEDIITAAMND
jgi:predicted RNA-binding protein (virulence factor B family)